jgi:hypothetical protein
MSITTVEEGKIVLPPGIDWPDGTIVRIEPVNASRPSAWDVLKKYEGIADDLPADMAANHDDYRSLDRRPSF